MWTCGPSFDGLGAGHQLPGIHHVYEYADNKLPWDLGFLIIGGVGFLLVGWALMRGGRHDIAARDGAA